jgi:hypothetical protein
MFWLQFRPVDPFISDVLKLMSLVFNGTKWRSSEFMRYNDITELDKENESEFLALN